MKKFLIIGLSLCLSIFAVACNKSTATSTDAELSDSGNSVKVVENQKTVNEVEKENKTEVNSSENNADSKKEDATNKKSSDEEKSKEEKTSFDVTLTYPSTTYVVDGNEEDKVVKNSVTIESSEKDIVEKVIDSLKSSSSPEGAEPTGLDKYTIKDSYLEGDKAIVDFSSDGLEGSSMDEEIIVKSIVNSLLSVKGIKSVELKVDGKLTESLMGHMDTSSAFTNFVE